MLPIHSPTEDLAAHLPDALARAAALIGQADALIIGAGAGMSADSGIPVYRGPDGLYTQPQALVDANAAAFDDDPVRAAETTRQRYARLLGAQPHAGYANLNEWRQAKPYGAFVYTSNVDGMFARAGFPADTVYEVHGSHVRSQCLTGCGGRAPTVFDTPPPTTAVATCPGCGEVARPNVLMFGDYAFSDTHREQQWEAFGAWFDALPALANVVVLEIGAGDDVRTVRFKCESLAAAYEWPLIRINPNEPALPASVPNTSIALPLTSAEALHALDTLIGGAVG